MFMVLSWVEEKHMCLRVVILFTSISGAPGQMEYRGYLGASLSSLNCIVSILKKNFHIQRNIFFWINKYRTGLFVFWQAPEAWMMQKLGSTLEQKKYLHLFLFLKSIFLSPHPSLPKIDFLSIFSKQKFSLFEAVPQVVTPCNAPNLLLMHKVQFKGCRERRQSKALRNHFWPVCTMYLCKLQIVFLFKLLHIFVLIAKCICPNC